MNTTTIRDFPHLFVSDVDGCLYRTDIKDWSRLPPLRANYCHPHSEIKTVADLKATLRYGEFAWPGGYQIHCITSDGASLLFSTVRKELRSIVSAIRDDYRASGWRVVATDINYEDADLTDAHTNEPIEPAYGREEE